MQVTKSRQGCHEPLTQHLGPCLERVLEEW
jgi:hypothetical protein